MTLPSNFNPYTMELESTSEESKKQSSPKEGGKITDGLGENPQIDNAKKLAEVRGKLKKEDTKELIIDNKNEKELSSEEIRASIEQHISSVGNNNTIASIARISKLR